MWLHSQGPNWNYINISSSKVNVLDKLQATNWTSDDPFQLQIYINPQTSST